jgi:hypothetical protein
MFVITLNIMKRPVLTLWKACKLTDSVLPGIACHSESPCVFYWIVCSVTRNSNFHDNKKPLFCTVLTSYSSKQNQFTPVKNQNMKLKVLDSLQMIQCNCRCRDQVALSNCCLRGVHFETNPVKQWNVSLNHTHKIFTCLCFPLLSK